MENQKYGWNEAELALFQVMLKGLNFAVTNEPKEENVQVFLGKGKDWYLTLEPHWKNWEEVHIQKYEDWREGSENLGWFLRKDLVNALLFMKRQE